MRVALLAVVVAVVFTAGASAGDVRAARACPRPLGVFTAYRVHTSRLDCYTAHRVIQEWVTHDCGVSSQYGGRRSNSCRVRAVGLTFVCRTRYVFAQVSRSSCRSGRRVVKFRFDPS